jgi:hypothetical protein
MAACDSSGKGDHGKISPKVHVVSGLLVDNADGHLELRIAKFANWPVIHLGTVGSELLSGCDEFCPSL